MPEPLGDNSQRKSLEVTLTDLIDTTEMYLRTILELEESASAWGSLARPFLRP